MHWVPLWEGLHSLMCQKFASVEKNSMLQGSKKKYNSSLIREGISYLTRASFGRITPPSLTGKKRTFFLPATNIQFLFSGKINDTQGCAVNFDCENGFCNSMMICGKNCEGTKGSSSGRATGLCARGCGFDSSQR